MPTPAVSGSFGDLLDVRFQKIWNDARGTLPEIRPMLFETAPSNGRNDMRWSDVGAFGDFEPFVGEVTYQGRNQGYDTVSTPLEFTSGFAVERKLYDDDQYNIMDRNPSGLADSYVRTREKDAARMFNNAFGVDSYFYVNSENVPLCSNSHTTTDGDADTTSGFDNLVTTSLSAVAVAAAREQMVGFRDDRGNRIPMQPDEIMISQGGGQYEIAFEIVSSRGKVDQMTNNANVHEGAYKIIEWNYLTDANNWFMMDSRRRKQSLYWLDRIAVEFGYVEEFDTLVAKWRAYARWANAHIDWRWILGAQVS
ncbi:MAG: hypothetical protein WA210_20290 [Burkholderiaceae bacterium]